MSGQISESLTKAHTVIIVDTTKVNLVQPRVVLLSADMRILADAILSKRFEVPLSCSVGDFSLLSK